MSFFEYIVTVLLSLQPAYADEETWEQRADRMRVIAGAIDDASSRATCEDKYNTPDCKKTWNRSKRSLALLLVTKGFWESKFAKNVHEGKCRSYECDALTVNGNRIHRARSPWQVQRTGLVSKEEYAEMNSSSLQSTVMSANVATRYLVLGMNMCKTIQGTIAVYGGAKSCAWKGAQAREAFYNTLSKKSETQLHAEAANHKKTLEERLSKKSKK